MSKTSPKPIQFNNLEKIITLMPGNVYWKDKDGRFLGCNQNMATILKLPSPAAIVGKANAELFDKYLAKLAEANDQQVMASNKEQTFEEEGLDVYGNQAIYLTRKVPLHNEKNEVVGILGSSFDITLQKKLEKEIIETTQQLEKANQKLSILAASIAHEIRTPLATINLGISNLQKYLPSLIDYYLTTTKKDMGGKKIPIPHLTAIKKLPNRIHEEVYYSNSMIDMMLVNISPSKVSQFKLNYSIIDCIGEAINRYPFQNQEKNLVYFNQYNEFNFCCDNRLHIIHVFFNLLKNAVYHVKAAGKGNIEIWLEKRENFNRVHFKDTGTGIPEAMLPNIFKKFFSNTPNGGGIGLSFCKATMNDLGGDIICSTIENEHTEFILSFPAID